MAGSGEVVHSRLRGGNAHSGRGAASFLTESFNRVRTAGATGPLTLRADSGFYNHKVVDACRAADVRYSITAKLFAGLKKVIEAIDESAWTPIAYFSERRRGGRDHLSALRPQGPGVSAHRPPGAAHAGQPAGLVQRVLLPRLHHRPPRRHARARSRPPPPRRDRERHPRPQIRRGPQPLSLGALRRQRRLARPGRHCPQPRPLQHPSRTRRRSRSRPRPFAAVTSASRDDSRVQRDASPCTCRHAGPGPSRSSKPSPLTATSCS